MIKKVVAVLAVCLLAGFAQAEFIDLGTNSVALPQATLTGFNVSTVQYNQDDDSWRINADPVIDYAAPQSGNGVDVDVMIHVSVSILVTRAEIEAVTGGTVDDITVKTLSDTVNAIALSKAIAVLSEE